MSKSAEYVFIDFLRSRGQNITPQRKIIVETFLDTKGHFTAERLAERVKQRAPDLGMATVYRSLKLLVESGLADTIDQGDGVIRYEHGYGHAHHDHLICVNCGKKVEVSDDTIEERQESVATEHGFKLTRHRMLLYGLCPNCQGKTA